MRTKKQLLLFALPALLLAGCSNEEFTDDPGGQTPAGGDIEFAIGFAPTTRAATAADFTSTWEDGDQIGVFAVANGSTLAASGNHIHNVKLTYNSASGGSWSLDGGVELWFPPSGGKLDFYAYHPYDDNGGNPQALNPKAIAFNVSADQSGTTDGKPNYNLSDLLTAKSDNGGNGWAKADGAVSLTFSHALAMVQVTVDDKVSALDINEEPTVKLRGVKAGAALNLGASSGPKVELATTGNDPGDITMHRVPDADGYVYRALVPAQTLAQDASIFRIISGDVLLNGAKLTATVNMTGGRAETFTQKTPITALPLVKKGAFNMGSPADEPNRQPNETQHPVTLTKDFYISRYQITNAQYAVFLNAKGIQGETESGKTVGKDGGNILVYDSHTPMYGGNYDWGVQWNSASSRWEASQYNGTDHSDYPVIHVTWYGANAYADWVGGALPTEAQWEYACRGGTTTAFYFGGNENDLGDYGWSWGNNTTSGYQSGTKPVGLKKPNDYGLYDMHGNVLEWCSDWYAANFGSTNAADAVTDPAGPSAGTVRVLRGGNWGTDAQLCRSAYRSSAYPNNAHFIIGFRVVFVPQFMP